MFPVRTLSLAALLGCAMITFAVVPVAAADSAVSVKKKKGDPNEVVCRKEEVLGSRLQTQRVCMTRSEWAEANRQQRSEVERRQVQRGTAGQ